MKRLASLIENDDMRMAALEVVSQLDLEDCYIAAGFLRNLYWDFLHNKDTPLNDIDVIFFDVSDNDQTKEKAAETTLISQCPQYNWQVRNQAFMHLKNGDKPYKNSCHAMSYWPEKETAIAARLLNQHIEIISPFELTSLYGGFITHNPKRDRAIFLNRIQSKGWQLQWPKLRKRL